MVRTLNSLAKAVRSALAAQNMNIVVLALLTAVLDVNWDMELAVQQHLHSSLQRFLQMGPVEGVRGSHV